MRNNAPLHIIFLLLFLLGVINSRAQNFSYQAQLQEVTESGFHRIILNPDVESKVNPNDEDLRLFDSKLIEVPYVLEYPTRTASKDSTTYVTIKKEEYHFWIDSSSKASVLEFKFKNVRRIDKIILKINSPENYLRNAIVYTYETKFKNGRKKIVKNHIASFTIHSAVPHELDIYDLRSDNFYIEITNNDNFPLQITHVVLKQMPLILIADLKKGEEYILKFGSPKLRKPKYDLSYFVDKSKKMPFIKLKDVEQLIAEPNKSVNKYEDLGQSRWFLWSCICSGAIILFFFTRNMLKEMKKKQREIS